MSKTVAFIDGNSLYGSAKTVGLETDFIRIREWLDMGTDLIRAKYYAAMPDDPEEPHPLWKLIDWLEYNRYAIFTKSLKRYNNDGQEKVKGSVSVEIAVDMMDASSYVTHMVIFSGDSDLRHAIETVQRRGIFVTVVCAMRQVSDELRRQADWFIDIGEYKDTFSKVRKEEVGA